MKTKTSEPFSIIEEVQTIQNWREKKRNQFIRVFRIYNQMFQS